MWPFSRDKKLPPAPEDGALAPRTLIEYVKPWLAMLDLYRRLGRRQEFEAMAYRVHFEFNVRYSRWAEEGGAACAPSIEDYPHVMAGLLAVWGSPECEPFLNGLVADNRGGLRAGFPPEVFADILLLLQVAEALAAADVGGQGR